MTFGGWNAKPGKPKPKAEGSTGNGFVLFVVVAMILVGLVVIAMFFISTD